MLWRPHGASVQVDCSKCGGTNHHLLLCVSEDKKIKKTKPTWKGASNLSHRNSLALYPIQQAKVCVVNEKVAVFCESGSDTTYITHQAADRIKAKGLKSYTLDETTMGNGRRGLTPHCMSYL